MRFLGQVIFKDLSDKEIRSVVDFTNIIQCVVATMDFELDFTKTLHAS